MIHFEENFFKKFKFEADEIERHLESALHDLDIARKDSFPEVQFSYSFQALIKAGITLIAKAGNVKVRSLPGHHVKILSKMSEILQDQDILTLGNAMRMKRNTDLYGGGQSITEKEARDYLKFVERIILRVEKIIRLKG